MSEPRVIRAPYADADADHAPVAESAFGDGIADNCRVCGLAVTSDGKRHGRES